MCALYKCSLHGGGGGDHNERRRSQLTDVAPHDSGSFAVPPLGGLERVSDVVMQ